MIVARRRRCVHRPVCAGASAVVAVVLGAHGAALAQCGDAAGPASTIAGHVVDRWSKPVEYADVILARNGDDKVLCHYVTDKDGAFAAAVPPGVYRIEASAYSAGERPVARMQARYDGSARRDVTVTLPVGGMEDRAKRLKSLLDILTTVLAFVSGWVFGNARDWLRRKRERDRAVSFYLRPAAAFATSARAVKSDMSADESAGAQARLEEELKTVEDTVAGLLSASWTLGSLKREFFEQLLEKQDAARRLRKSLLFTAEPRDAMHFLATLNRGESLAAWAAEQTAVDRDLTTLATFA